MIKFKAYVEEEKKVLRVLSIDFEDETLFVDMEHTDYANQELYGFSDVIFLQFTGLLDKNGTEIYEGDIICCNQHHGSYVIQNKVIFEINSMWSRLRKDSTFKDIEIIGNKFENPELLGESK